MKYCIPFLFFVVCARLSFAQHYKPAPESKVHFVIKNFGIKTGGDLSKINGNISFNAENIANSKFDVSVQSSTVDTDNNMRDKSLKADYFDSEKFPEIRIVSTRIAKTNKTDDGFYFFTGNLIMKGITRQISFPFKAEKQGDGFLFTADFEINRLDYNVGSSSTVLGNLVAISLKVLAKKQ